MYTFKVKKLVSHKKQKCSVHQLSINKLNIQGFPQEEESHLGNEKSKGLMLLVELFSQMILLHFDGMKPKPEICLRSQATGSTV